MLTVRDELRKKFPGMASGSVRGSVALFCAECCGGELAEARRCAEKTCFLWPHGPAARMEKRRSAESEKPGLIARGWRIEGTVWRHDAYPGQYRGPLAALAAERGEAFEEDEGEGDGEGDKTEDRRGEET
jgi:hypothetical protein